MRDSNNNIVVFLDRDGTINKERGLINHVDRLELIPGAAQGILVLNKAGIKVVVVTNQPGVGRKIISNTLLQQTFDRLKQMLSEYDAFLDGIYVCPHFCDSSNITCECHKPLPGLVNIALKDLCLSPARMYVVGDRRVDMELASAIGAKSILVMTGYGLGEWEHHRESFENLPDHVAIDLEAAAYWIIKQENINVYKLPTPGVT